VEAGGLLVVSRTSTESAGNLSARIVGKVILLTTYMCIIPWLEWTPSNHLYITHRGLQLVVKQALMMLARNGIHRELALAIVGKFMDMMKNRQVILNHYAWDDHFLAYEKTARALSA
jgi:Na+/alanine symporter